MLVSMLTSGGWGSKEGVAGRKKNPSPKVTIEWGDLGGRGRKEPPHDQEEAASNSEALKMQLFCCVVVGNVIFGSFLYFPNIFTVVLR